MASTSPPERHDPVRYALTELGEITAQGDGVLSIEIPNGTWTPTITDERTSAEELAELLRARCAGASGKT